MSMKDALTSKAKVTTSKTSVVKVDLVTTAKESPFKAAKKASTPIIINKVSKDIPTTTKTQEKANKAFPVPETVYTSDGILTKQGQIYLLYERSFKTLDLAAKERIRKSISDVSLFTVVESNIVTQQIEKLFASAMRKAEDKKDKLSRDDLKVYIEKGIQSICQMVINNINHIDINDLDI